MAKLSSCPLRPNPFHTYRDPKTGKWRVVKLATSETYYCPPVDSLSSVTTGQGSQIPELWTWPLASARARLAKGQASPWG